MKTLCWSLTPKNTIEEWQTKKPVWKIELTRYTRELEVYSILPWLGYSYYLFDIDVAIYHLIPFNRIIRLWKDFIYWLRWGKAKEQSFAKRMEINNRSYEKGCRDGWNDAIREMQMNGYRNFVPR